MARRGDRLRAGELKNGAHEDVRARAKYVSAQEAVAVRTVGLCQIVEHAHGRFQHQLQLTRHQAEPGHRKHAQKRRGHQQNASHRESGNQPWVDLHAEKGHFVALVQHSVAHELFDGFSFAAVVCENGPHGQQGNQRNCHAQHGNSPLFAQITSLPAPAALRKVPRRMRFPSVQGSKLGSPAHAIQIIARIYERINPVLAPRADFMPVLRRCRTY